MDEAEVHKKSDLEWGGAVCEYTRNKKREH